MVRTIIGIDLGTTNCALAYVDLEQPSMPVQLFSIPQLTAAGKIDSLPTLPSFGYLVEAGEWPPGALRLPWKEEKRTFVGQFAKAQGARVPTRSIQSAKSWLCNVAANRCDKILPLDAAEFSRRLTPVEASANYLVHLRDAWNASKAKGNPDLEFEEQEIILTVPASFDEVARSLTVEAARQAGLVHITLLEEPQAAFYSWISAHEQEWKTFFKKGDTLLVCDVGGGTTDFSLIEIQEENYNLFFQRMAVGDHLLLGGDNMDAALAHYAEEKLVSQGHSPLESDQWSQLLAEARTAKEVLLDSGIAKSESYSIVLHGTGSSVVRGSLSTSITRHEIEGFLSNGFFGVYPLNEAVQIKPSRGFRTMGLPYEDEPSISKHLAHFLKRASPIEKGKGIDFVLFNGGTLKPEIFKERIEESLRTWFPQTQLKRLSSENLDLAVARGAAYYGKVRRGFGVAIRGGLPRAIYLKIDVKDNTGKHLSKALTLLPRGSREEMEFISNQVFSLRPNVPVSFHLITSHIRLHDNEGDLVEIDPLEMQTLPPMQTILRFGKNFDRTDATIPVVLGIRLTQIGTIELWLQSRQTEHKWSLEFQLRSASGSQEPSVVHQPIPLERVTYEKEFLERAKLIVESLFTPNSKPNQLMEDLEAKVGKSKREWGLGLIRELWNPLLKKGVQRKMTVELEAKWWNLAGFFLRPGYGFPLDDFRVKELWKIILAELKTQKNPDCLIQMWICLRRVAGGLNKGQQMQVAAELAPSIFDRNKGKIETHRKGDLYLYSEKIRLLASLERLELSLKIKIGEALVDRISHHSPASYDYWSLGRIGARHLVYGSPGQVVPKEICSGWVEQLLAHQPTPENHKAMLFSLQQMARKSDHRELNLSEPVIKKILDDYPQKDLEKWLLEGRQLTQNEQEQVFGDQLPAGLILDIGGGI